VNRAGEMVDDKLLEMAMSFWLATASLPFCAQTETEPIPNMKSLLRRMMESPGG
jgi:hypothetical protein